MALRHAESFKIDGAASPACSLPRSGSRSCPSPCPLLLLFQPTYQALLLLQSRLSSPCHSLVQENALIGVPLIFSPLCLLFPSGLACLRDLVCVRAGFLSAPFRWLKKRFGAPPCLEEKTRFCHASKKVVTQRGQSEPAVFV